MAARKTTKKVTKKAAKRTSKKAPVKKTATKKKAAAKKMATKKTQLKKLFVRLGTGDFKEVEGKSRKIKIKGLEKFEMYAVQFDIESKHPNWKVLEPVSGSLLHVVETSLDKVKVSAEKEVKSFDGDTAYQEIAACIAVHGTAPGWEMPEFM